MAAPLPKMRGSDWAAVAGVVVVLIVAAYVLIGLSVRKIGRLNDEAAQLSSELEGLVRLNDAVRSAERVIAALDQQRESLAAQIPSAMDSSQFYGALTDAAAATGVTLERVQPSGLHKTAEYVYQPLEIDASGAFPKLYEFVYRATHQPRLSKVARMNLTATEDPGLCKLALTLHIYAAAPEAGG
ncbi:MAG: type 4a pilus biogenesis protein PilO [Candidatus Hydrogenedentes bacterium]|nr:type 4a pilus biogenesis protein PilO [Candidatus Hydrogenedentota bacterium]